MSTYMLDSFQEPAGKNIRRPRKIAVQSAASTAGSVPSATSPYITITEEGNGLIHQTVLTLSGLPITMRDTEQGGGAKIYSFPLGRLLYLGGTASIAVTTTSVLASTLNAGVTCNWGVGTVTQANGTVATTEQDLINVQAFVSSATINVAGATVAGVGVASVTPHDGTSTAKSAFLNLAVAGATDIDANATVTVSGTIRLTWINLGDT